MVHVYTATGAVGAFSVIVRSLPIVMGPRSCLMVAATVIHATDGMLARLARVKEHARLDGARLDDIVDYLTFVFCRLLLSIRAGVFLPAGAPSRPPRCC